MRLPWQKKPESPVQTTGTYPLTLQMGGGNVWTNVVTRNTIFQYAQVDPPEEQATQTEPVVAWRQWSLTKKGRLRGMNSQVWPSRFYAAGCTNHESPHWGCNCGVNACKEAHLFEGVAYPNPGGVYGRVELSGTVHEYERAFRASHANIIELVVIEESPGARQDTIDQLAARYDVPVTGREAPDFIDQIRVIAALEESDERGETETDDQNPGETAGTDEATFTNYASKGTGEDLTPYLGYWPIS